jgi:hypothetical protein
MRLVGADERRPLVAEEYVGIDNDPMLLAADIARAGPDPEVVIEATYGWYWVVDYLQNECGAEVHPAHPLGLNRVL